MFRSSTSLIIRFDFNPTSLVSPDETRNSFPIFTSIPHETPLESHVLRRLRSPQSSFNFRSIKATHYTSTTPAKNPAPSDTVK